MRGSGLFHNLEQVLSTRLGEEKLCFLLVLRFGLQYSRRSGELCGGDWYESMVLVTGFTTDNFTFLTEESILFLARPKVDKMFISLSMKLRN